MPRNRLVSVRMTDEDLARVDALSAALDAKSELAAANYRLRNTRSAAILYAVNRVALDEQLVAGDAPPAEAAAST